MLKKFLSISLILLLLTVTCWGGVMSRFDAKMSDSDNNVVFSKNRTSNIDADSTAIFNNHLQLFIKSLEEENIELYVIEDAERVIDYRPDSIKKIDKKKFLDFANKLCSLSYIPLSNYHSFYEAKKQYTVFIQKERETIQAINVVGNFAILNISNHYANGDHTLFVAQENNLPEIYKSFISLFEQSDSMNIMTAEKLMRKMYSSDEYNYTVRGGNIYAVKVKEDDKRKYCLTIDCTSTGGLVGYRPCYSFATTLDAYDKETGEWIEIESKFAGVLSYSMFDGSLL